MSLPIAIVASGNGTNAQAMIDLMHKGVLDVDIRLIFCNRPNARVIERAKAAGIPWQMEDHKLYPTREAFDAVMIDALKKSGAELIVLAGYMRLLTKSFLDAFKNRVVNIHPSLLAAVCTQVRMLWHTGSSSRAARCISWRWRSIPAPSLSRQEFPVTPRTTRIAS